ncbi:outer membrane beta-barrel family protein [Gaoshiqia sediminis]|uniref:TonB-dependent receptor family protein n=1 Tax=Gaoshiqia sediminis TaxID=2986998 RepID=A0AA41Y9U6_9BACT|nr:outer membrane beta-barrel family protein [Gaoshiqia sediminis]MCW0484839.1 TonB-dependent receptor family protein [Gaoshiqia sediminis]
MLKPVLFLFFIFGCIVSFAQNGATISGRIYDGETNQPLPFASITINIENNIISGTISDEDGRFSFSGIEKENYIVKCSFVGYQTSETEMLVGELNDNFDVGKIMLSPAAEELDEVTIKAKQEIVSSDLDKRTFSMDDNIAQSGGSVLDAMKAMPGIAVTQDGKVMLRGSDKVAVLIDGKQSSLTGFGNQKGLDNIPAANIESIEIINNPSAKYDASGMAGIVNIIYKKEKEFGFNGDIGFAYGMGVFSKQKEDLPTELGSYSLNPKYIPSLNLNYRTEKFNYSLQSEILFQEKLPNNEFTTRMYDDGTNTISQVPENRTQKHYIVNGGIDYLIDENNTLTFSGVYDWEHHIDTAQVPFINMNTGQRYRYWHWNEDEITGFMSFALNYNHQFAEPGHEIDARFQFTKGWEDESYFLNDSSDVRQGQDATHIVATEYTTNIAVDYVKPLSSGRLETGLKMQWRRLPVEYTTTPGENSIIYPGIGDWSDWGEDIYAAYFNYIYEKPKLDIEGGLRVEQTNVFYSISPENIYYDENDSYNYFELFPNIRLTFKPDDKNRVSAFYNRRIDRPGEPELRIFPKYDDPELVKVGNPYLRPQFTQTFELAYKRIWQEGSLFLSAYHRLIEDAYQRVYGIDESNEDYSLINKIYQNTGSSTNTGFEIIFSQNLTKSWKLSGSFNGYNNSIDAYEGTLLFPYERPFYIEETSDKTWDGKLNNQFKFEKGWEIQLTGIYYAEKTIPQGKQLARSSIDLGIKKNVLKGKGEISFAFSDIFNDFALRQEYEGDGFKVLYENYYETQVARLGLKYKF